MLSGLARLVCACIAHFNAQPQRTVAASTILPTGFLNTVLNSHTVVLAACLAESDNLSWHGLLGATVKCHRSLQSLFLHKHCIVTMVTKTCACPTGQLAQHPADYSVIFPTILAAVCSQNF